MGATLYELLTSRPPFRGESARATVLQVLNQEVVPPGKLRKKLSRDLEAICLKCLEKNPAKRSVSAGGLADDLTRWRTGRNSEPARGASRPLLPAAGYNPPVPHPPPGSIMSHRTLPLLLLVIASLGCGGKPSADTKPEPPPAPAPTTAAKPPADPNAPSGDRTLAYLQDVGKLQELAARKLAALADPDPAVVKPLLTDTAKGIEELPTDKVDADAVAVGKGLADELRLRADAKPTTPDAATLARSTRAALAKKYGREFPDLTSADKEPAFRLGRDMDRPTLAQELARLKAESAAFDGKIKPVNDKLTEETFTKDKLQGEADSVRTLLKMQTEDADLKKLREEVLADAVKELEAKKKDIDVLTKQVNALRAEKAALDRLASEVSAVLAEGDPAKAEKLPLDRLDRLRVQADRVSDKLAARKK